MRRFSRWSLVQLRSGFAWAMVTLAVALSTTTALRAQNLIQNGEFTTDLSHWTPLNSLAASKVYRSSLGFDGYLEPLKGSVVILEARPTYNQFNDVRQCVSPAALPSSLSFRAFAWAGERSSNGAGTDAEAILLNYSGANCSGTVLGAHDYRQAIVASQIEYSANPQGPDGLTRWKRLWFSYPPPVGTKSVLVILQVVKRFPDSSAYGGFDDVYLGAATPEDLCARSDLYGNGFHNCLRYDQFSVTADWKTPDGKSGHGTAVPLTEDSGAFWFFNASNLELIVKVLDACGLNDRYWVFAGGLTNVEVTLTVTDTYSGQVKIYKNPLNHTFTAFQDTNAFATCP